MFSSRQACSQQRRKPLLLCDWRDKRHRRRVVQEAAKGLAGEGLVASPVQDELVPKLVSH